MIDWKLQSRSHGCQACGKAFADKQSYFTLLLEHRHELVRQDVCARCWEAKYSQGAKDNKEFISFWQGVFNQAPPPPPEAIQKESAETLLRKLIERGNPVYAAACFILAVMLERKRMLKVKAQSSLNGRRTIIYEHPKTGDVFSIADPDLHLDKLAEVQRTVSHLLENGLPPDGSEKAAETGPGLNIPPGDATNEAEPTASPPAPAAGGERTDEKPAGDPAGSGGEPPQTSAPIPAATALSDSPEDLEPPIPATSRTSPMDSPASNPPSTSSSGGVPDPRSDSNNSYMTAA